MFKFEFDRHSVNLIFKALGKMPYEETFEIISDIHGQISNQERKRHNKKMVVDMGHKPPPPPVPNDKKVIANDNNDTGLSKKIKGNADNRSGTK
jgi:hypothetical protein